MRQVFVGTSAKYNAGSVVGKWLRVDAYADKDSFLEACAALHNDETDPVIMFLAWVEIPNAMINEYSIDDDVWSEAAISAPGAVSAFIDIHGAWDEDVFNDVYHGEFADEMEFTKHLVAVSGYLSGLPQPMRRYFDYWAFNSDLLDGGEYRHVDGYVFRNIW